MAESLVNLFAMEPGRVHVMGICGAGAAGIAWMLHLRGWKVSGCDKHIPPTMDKFFVKNGIQVNQGHAPGHLADCDALVYSAAIRSDEPELALARAGGLKVLSRGECLAGWVSGLRSVAVCGTHGKTTASCFVTRLLQLAGQRPLWCLGGYTPRLLTNAGPRDGDLAGTLRPDQLGVAEADESDGTLAYEHPAILLITNIEPDHLDHFRDAEEIERCFAAAVENTREGVVVCADAPRAMRVAARFQRGPILTYGFSQDAMVRAVNLERLPDGTRFTLMMNGQRRAEVTLLVPGDHNVLNALGALAAGLQLGLDAGTLIEALPKACAELPKRRFQWTTSHHAPVRVVVDYAHHPTEILAMLSIARLQHPKRIRLVFQPHRYSRTKRLLPDFVKALTGVDEVILLPVYAASESPDKGCESYALYAAMRTAAPQQAILLAQTPDEVLAYLRRTAAEGDLILVVGAGDVERIGHQLGETPLPDPSRSQVCEVLAKALPAGLQLVADEPLARHTCYRVGGTVDAYVTPTDIPTLSALCRVCKAHRIPLRFSGSGANSWFSDLGMPGVLCALRGTAFEGYARDGETIRVGAGLSGAWLLKKLEQEGLSGLEFMQNIPGTVGGWARMNAGAHGHAFWECVAGIRVVWPDGQINHLAAQAVKAGYREVEGLEGAAIVEVTLRLHADEPEAIRARRQDFGARRVELEGLRTCGSLFKNPQGASAGATLDALGAKQWRVGGAYVFEKHANIVIAGAEATASDILALMLQMRDVCSASRKITLLPEVHGLPITGAADAVN